MNSFIYFFKRGLSYHVIKDLWFALGFLYDGNWKMVYKVNIEKVEFHFTPKMSYF